MKKEILGWHFLLPDGRVRRYHWRNGPAPCSGMEVRVGQTLTVPPPIETCKRGLHASVSPLEAMRYAPGPICCRVRLSGIVAADELNLNYAASKRTALAVFNADTILEAWARWCSLQLADAWNAPAAVREWLESGNPNLREAAEEATTHRLEQNNFSRLGVVGYPLYTRELLQLAGKSWPSRRMTFFIIGSHYSYYHQLNSWQLPGKEPPFISPQQKLEEFLLAACNLTPGGDPSPEEQVP